MTTEETIDKVRLLAKQRCRRNVRKIKITLITLLIILFGIFCAGYGLFLTWENHNDWWSVAPVAFVVMLFVLALVLWLIEVINGERNEYLRVEYELTRNNKDCISFFNRGCVFKDYGFYDAAIKDFDEALQFLNKESEQIAESLRNFFDEYNAKTKCVNGIHRPVPSFRNHDWYWLRQCHIEKKTCLMKMGKSEEVETEIELLKTISTFIEENNTITEKYWKD
jgi:tetratricopeptide (TPR) repeat protein